MLTSGDFTQIDKRVDKIIKKRLDLFEKRITKKLNLLISYSENEFYNHKK